jgi:hypothetical protein
MGKYYQVISDRGVVIVEVIEDLGGLVRIRSIDTDVEFPFLGDVLNKWEFSGDYIEDENGKAWYNEKIISRFSLIPPTEVLM